MQFTYESTLFDNHHRNMIEMYHPTFFFALTCINKHPKKFKTYLTMGLINFIYRKKNQMYLSKKTYVFMQFIFR